MMWGIAALLIAQLSAKEQSVSSKYLPLNKYERLGKITATINHCIIFWDIELSVIRIF